MTNAKFHQINAGHNNLKPIPSSIYRLDVSGLCTLGQKLLKLAWVTTGSNIDVISSARAGVTKRSTGSATQ